MATSSPVRPKAIVYSDNQCTDLTDCPAVKHLIEIKKIRSLSGAMITKSCSTSKETYTETDPNTEKVLILEGYKHQAFCNEYELMVDNFEKVKISNGSHFTPDSESVIAVRNYSTRAQKEDIKKNHFYRKSVEVKNFNRDKSLLNENELLGISTQVDKAENCCSFELELESGIRLPCVEQHICKRLNETIQFTMRILITEWEGESNNGLMSEFIKASKDYLKVRLTNLTGIDPYPDINS